MPRKLGKDLKPLPGYGVSPEHAKYLREVPELRREVKKRLAAIMDNRRGKSGGVWVKNEDEKRKERDEKLTQMIKDTTPAPDRSVYEIKGK